MPSPYILNATRDSIQEDPELAVLRNGNVVAVWEDLALDPGSGGTFGIYGAILSPDLTLYVETSFRAPQYTNRLQLDPQVTALEDGGFAVGWHSDGRGARSGVRDPYFDGCLRFFEADGTPRTGEIQLTPQITKDQYIQDVATLANGSVVALVARQLYGAVYDLVAYRYSADGERLDVATLAQEVDMLTNSFGGQANPAAQIAVTDGGYAVAWYAHEDRVTGADGRRIYTRLFENDGDAKGPARIVSEDNPQQLDQEEPRIIAVAGGFAVAWNREMSDSDFSQIDVAFRLLDASGRPASPVRVVNSGDRPGEQTLGDLVHLGGGMTLVTYESQVGPSWDDTQTLEGRVFGADGRPLTGVFQISEFAFEGLESGNSVLTRHGLASAFEADTDMSEDIIGSTSTPRLTFSGGAGDDRIAGSILADRLIGLGGDDTLLGKAGDDTLRGGDSADVLVGGDGADKLVGGDGRDTLGYRHVLESTGRDYDTIVGFNASSEFFDLPVAVTGIDPRIGSGRLNESSFNSDLAAAADAAALLAHHAVVFKPDSGGHAGEAFLVADANGVPGYQTREDFVLRLDNPVNLGSLSTDRFV